MKLTAADSIRDSITCFLRYLELRLQLFGLDARDAGLHLLVLSLLLCSVLVCFAGFIMMLIVFLLNLMMLILHWDWGWCALTLAVGLLLISVAIGLIFRFRITKALFPVTLAEFQKDRQWLKQNTKNSNLLGS